jgi:CubicO group peptidase (beta-lactamase class C family)
MKNIFPAILSFLLLLSFVSNTQLISIEADSLLNAYHQQDLFTGTVLIAQNGKTVFEKSYGMANREEGITNNSQTQYRIGSISKPFTALIILQLIEKKQLNINDRLSKYIPEIPKADSITIEHLLNHTSGIKSFTSTKPYMQNRMDIKSKEDVITILKAEPFVFSPGSKWQYSNSNYMLLSYIAEKITGKPMAELVKTFSDKYGLKNTGMDYDGRKSATKAIGYEAGTFTDYQTVADQNISIITGAGGIYSTASDLLKLDNILYTDGIVSNATKQKMFTAGKGDYGWGWEISDYKGRKEISHTGSIEGFKSVIHRFPESQTTIIFLSNYWNTQGQQISEGLKAIAFGEDFKIPPAKKFVTLSPDQLKNYEGEYSFKGVMTMNLKSELGLLLSEIKGQPVVSFKPMTENSFYNKSNNAEIEFTRDSEGKIISFKLIKGRQVMEWEKVDAK